MLHFAKQVPVQIHALQVHQVWNVTFWNPAHVMTIFVQHLGGPLFMREVTYATCVLCNIDCPRKTPYIRCTQHTLHGSPSRFEHMLMFSHIGSLTGPLNTQPLIDGINEGLVVGSCVLQVLGVALANLAAILI